MKPKVLVTREVFDEVLTYLGGSLDVEANQSDVPFQPDELTRAIDTVAKATVVTLERMDVELVDTNPTDAGQTMKATAGDRKIEIELDRLTSKMTRMRVVAKKNWLIRDRATATEIILQTDRTLTEQSQKELAASGPRPTSPPPARKAQR